MCGICGFTNCVSSCPNYEPKIIGFCEKCGGIIYNSGEIWVDNDNNKFCSEECAKEYYEIEEI